MTAPPGILVVPAEVARLVEVRAFVRESLGGLEAPREAVDDLVQAVDETVCNVITHGYRGAPGSVEVEVVPSDGSVSVYIRDGAPPFDPTTVPTPDVSAPLAARRLGGMGVHLARGLTDRMQHRILPTGGNELTLVKSFAGKTGGESDGDQG